MSAKSIFRFSIVLVIIFLLVVIFGFNEWLIEYWWLDELGYSMVFWQIKEAQFLLMGGAFLISFIYLGINTRILMRNVRHVQLPAIQLQDRQINISKPGTLKKIGRILMAFAGLISVFLSLAFFFQWDRFFRFNWAQTAGETDPIFGLDYGFYMFRLPFLELGQSSLAGLTFIASVFLLVAYLTTGMIGRRNNSGFNIAPPARKHLGLNISLWLLIICGGLFLDRYGLLFDSSGVVYGPGYTDIHIVLPAIWILLAATFGLAVYAAALYVIDSVKGFLITAGGVALIGFAGFFLVPSLYQQLIVSPTELRREMPYLKHNIELSREGYKLDDIDEQQYDPSGELTMEDIDNNSGTIDNIRLWDPRLLIQTYRQLQEIRLYYQFYSVDIDRYQTGDGLYQMMLAARELDNSLPTRANTWVNRHLQYTHGYGHVMSPVAQEGKGGIPNLVVKDIPPVSTMEGLEVRRPEIYYGNDQSGYKFVNTGIKELDYPDGDENHYVRYQGEGGIPIENFFRKLIFAWDKGEMNIIFSEYIHPDSKFQIWRNVQQRVRKIAPFLKLDNDPYLVESEGRLFWIQDAYTTSSYFPYSESYNGSFNYIRNSVKVVVDAYDGSVDFYVVDESDPVIQVYQEIFPDLFHSLDEMPDGLEAHMRYPQDIFDVQIDMYASYHMTDPQVYYNNEDLWKRPKEKYGNNQIEMEPYYLLTKLPGEDRLEYVQIYPMTPNERDNMIGWIAARSDQPHYGDISVYQLPKDRLIYGPIQIDSRIDQNTEISQLLSLWDQRGSKVIRGNLMVIPIEKSFLYVEPVFLISEGVDIPQLQRVIVAYEGKIAMHRTMDASIEAIFDPNMTLVDTEVSRPGAEEVEALVDTTVAPPAPSVPDTTEISEEPTAFDREEVQRIWRETQQHMRSGDWEAFGQSMEELKRRIEENGQ